MKLYLLYFIFFVQGISCLLHHKYKVLDKEASIPQKYVIELQPGASASFLEGNPDVVIRRTFSHTLFQGVSIEILQNEQDVLGSILDHPDTAFVSPNRVIHSQAASITIPQKLSPDDVLKILPHELHQVDRARKELGLTGKGIFVGIIDSGVDYTLSALGGGFGKGFKIAAGWDFVGYENAAGPKSNSSEPLDLCTENSGTSGHGTHVSGIIAGDDPELNFEGVAPKATLGMWRALDCTGSGDLETLMEAALAAFDAGVDILSYSIGYPFPWNDIETPDYQVFKRMIEHGIFVVIAASNNGQRGAFTVDGLATSSFSVASTLNKHKPNQLNVRASGISDPINVLPYTYVKQIDKKTTYADGDLYIPLLNKTDLTSCAFEPASDQITGKWILVNINCPIRDYLVNIEYFGANGIMLYLNSDIEIFPGYIPTKLITLTMITLSNAKLLADAYQKGNVSLEFFEPKKAIVYNPLETTVSLFSSVGPTNDLGFSPNIAATGENVYSTMPRQWGGYGYMSGTSMATPYISGTLALYLEYHGVNKTNHDVVLAKYKNYASQGHIRENNGIVESPLRQGAGLVQIYDTITQSVYIMPPEISFKDSSFEEAKSRGLTITNEGNETVTYKIYNNVSIAIAPYDISDPGNYNYLEPALNVQEKAEIEFSATEIQVGPGESQTVVVKVVPPDTNPLSYVMYGGYIQFSPVSSDKHKSIHVPYFGIVGYRNQIPIFDPNSFYFAYTGHTQNYSYVGKVDNPPTIVHSLYSDSDASFIDIQYSLLGMSKVIKAELISHPSQQVIGDLNTEIYTGSLFKTRYVTFNGVYCDSNLNNTLFNYSKCHDRATNGTYAVRISALKLFGEEDNPNDYEVWSSIPFTIE